MTKKEAFNVVEYLLVRRISKFDAAINALSELDIDVSETSAQMREEREALRVMREVFVVKE